MDRQKITLLKTKTTDTTDFRLYVRRHFIYTRFLTLPFNDLHILKPDWKIIKRTSDRAIVFMLLSDEEEWGKIHRNSRTKYKNLIKEISPIDLTELMKSTLKENEKQLQKQINFWQRKFRLGK
ncbi:Replication initiation protein [Companilactobacillus bobalius]|uniref:Replication initiation protein n=2 Tax=Companilactobacillus bobalius TaxID=2801451 RepID=A0A202F339_9LACO|nr:Replication initiation protein [Companilactobacillus bobalius]